MNSSGKNLGRFLDSEISHDLVIFGKNLECFDSFWLEKATLANMLSSMPGHTRFHQHVSVNNVCTCLNGAVQTPFF